ncbi:MAG: hypothetical protein PHF86_00425 [Candidatus Nanoarchaeia archaeon]|nr:hypothetical protein [Candidatus Nanoarchaeia archaeon]
MKLIEIFKKEELFSKDIRQRINNKQITINGIPIKNNDLNIDINFYIDAGDYIFYNLNKFKTISFLNIDEMFECDIPYVKNLLKDFSLLKISKKKLFIFKN